ARQSVVPRRYWVQNGLLAERRAMSALTRPCTFTRTDESPPVVALIVTGPPSTVPVRFCARTIDSVNSTRPPACSTAGRSGEIATVLAANWYVPATLAFAFACRGIESFKVSLPEPRACQPWVK